MSSRLKSSDKIPSQRRLQRASTTTLRRAALHKLPPQSRDEHDDWHSEVNDRRATATGGRPRSTARRLATGADAGTDTRWEHANCILREHGACALAVADIFEAA